MGGRGGGGEGGGRTFIFLHVQVWTVPRLMFAPSSAVLHQQQIEQCLTYRNVTTIMIGFDHTECIKSRNTII